MNKYRVVRSVDHTGKEEFLVERHVGVPGTSGLWTPCTEVQFLKLVEGDGFNYGKEVCRHTLQEAINYIKDRIEKEKPIPKPTTEVVWESDNEQSDNQPQ